MLQAGERSPYLSRRGILLLSHTTDVLYKLLATWLCPFEQWTSIIEQEALHQDAMLITYCKALQIVICLYQSQKQSAKFDWGSCERPLFKSCPG